jgi:para-aminobenzoate synthetase component 2
MHYGWKLELARTPRHGKPSSINHRGEGIFADLPNPLQAGRYHSLVIAPGGSAKSELEIEAECDGEIMAVSASQGMVWGVQFHPESILTPSGQQLINQWVSLVANQS